MAVVLGNRAGGGNVRVVACAGFLFFAALFMTAYSARNPEVARSGYETLAEIQRPLQVVNRSLSSGVLGVWEGYVALRGVREENQLLRERVAKLESINSELLEYESENMRLRGLLAMQQSTKLTGKVANVIGYDPSSWQHALTLDKGANDGVMVGMAVLEGNGLVGQVTATSSHTARVLLLTDPLSGVDGIVQESRARGVVEGEGQSLCRWKFVQKDEPVNVGDRVITSGMDAVYPKGLLIGVVLEAAASQADMFQSIKVKPAVDFSKLESVMIVTSGAERP